MPDEAWSRRTRSVRAYSTFCVSRRETRQFCIEKREKRRERARGQGGNVPTTPIRALSDAERASTLVSEVELRSCASSRWRSLSRSVERVSVLLRGTEGECVRDIVGVYDVMAGRNGGFGLFRGALIRGLVGIRRCIHV